MAFQIEEIQINKSKIIAPLSRYSKSRTIKYGPIPKTTFETYKRSGFSPAENLTLITPGWEYRPDLVSFDVFGFPDLWWKIMEINGIFDILDFKSGLTIRLPKLSEELL